MMNKLLLKDSTEKVYWLHIDKDGREQHFAKGPDDLPTHRVTVVGDFEYCDNLCIGDKGHWSPIYSVPPRGEGWEIFDSRTSDNYTTWRRLAVRP